MKHQFRGIVQQLSIPLVFLCIFIGLSVGSAWSESLTFDEIVYIEEGIANLREKKFLVDPYNPPLIRELTALPILLGATNSTATPPNLQYFGSRLVVILLGCILIAAVYLFTKQEIGELPAYLTLVILVFEPTLLAHSHYITPDVGTATFVLLACMSVYYLGKRFSWQRSIITSILLGLALASRVSSLLYLSVVIMFVVVKERARIRSNIKKSVLVLINMLIIAGLTVWSTYFFARAPIIVTYSNPHRLSSKIIAFSQANKLPWLGGTVTALQNTPVPLGDYLGIVKNTILRARSARSDFFLGDVYPSRPYFLLIVYLLKTPLPLFVGVVVGLFANRRRASPALLFACISAGAIWGISLLLSLSPLVRYMLPALPWLAIIAAFGLSKMAKMHRWLLIGLLAWYIGSSLAWYPHFITYSNELVRGEQKYLWFSDSNIDWGQGLVSLEQYATQTSWRPAQLSYFGRDDASRYGFLSPIPWGSYKNDEICQLHPIVGAGTGVVISLTNWHQCGYRDDPRFGWNKVSGIVGHSLLVFQE